MTLNEKQAISLSISSEINKIINKYSNLDEPGYISVLTQDFVPIFKYILNTNLNNIKFEVSGLFIHKSPIIEFINHQPCLIRQSCEIGDLLIIYSRKGKHNKTLFKNSLLLQAKRNVSRISINDCQLWLYRNWPRFKYCNKKLQNKTRSIYPKSINSGAQYLLIDENPLSFWVSKPDTNLSRYKKFEDCLVDFIECTTGRQFSPNKHNPDSWAKMIYDLLENNKNRLYNARKAGHINKKSIISCLDYKSYENMSNNIINGIYGEYSEKEEDENSIINEGDRNLFENNYEGISTILIESLEEYDD